MELGHAYSVLVVSASAKFNESVRGLLPERFYWPVTVLTDAAGVLLLVKAEHFPDIDGRLTPQGVLVLSKPMSTQLFTQSMRLLCGTRERLRGLEKKNATIEEKMEEIRLVNRAKWLLIGELNMTEQEAHRYIEKQAMDRCVTKRAVAEQILSTYK